MCEFEGEPAMLDGGDGEDDRGVDKLLDGLEDPRVAHMDGEDGGSGERVK